MKTTTLIFIFTFLLHLGFKAAFAEKNGNATAWATSGDHVLVKVSIDYIQEIMQFEKDYTVEYSYDGQDRLIGSTSDLSEIGTTEYTNDEKGYVKEAYQRYEVKSLSGNSEIFENKTYFHYDDHDFLIKRESDTFIDGEFEYVTDYTNDSKGNMIKRVIRREDLDQLASITRFTYDENNFVKKTESKSSPIDENDFFGEMNLRTFYNDSKGRPLKIESDSSGDGDIDFEATFEYTFDEHDNIVREETYHNGELFVVRTNTWRAKAAGTHNSSSKITGVLPPDPGGGGGCFLFIK